MFSVTSGSSVAGRMEHLGVWPGDPGHRTPSARFGDLAGPGSAGAGVTLGKPLTLSGLPFPTFSGNQVG